MGYLLQRKKPCYGSCVAVIVVHSKVKPKRKYNKLCKTKQIRYKNARALSSSNNFLLPQLSVGYSIYFLFQHIEDNLFTQLPQTLSDPK